MSVEEEIDPPLSEHYLDSTGREHRQAIVPDGPW
jgi:hypothetical protein